MPPTNQSSCSSLAAYSSSAAASSSASASPSFLAGFFFLLLFFLLPVFRDRGCSRILRISSSSIFLSDSYLLMSRGGGPPSLVMPFLVMARNKSAIEQRVQWPWQPQPQYK